MNAFPYTTMYTQGSMTLWRFENVNNLWIEIFPDILLKRNVQDIGDFCYLESKYIFLNGKLKENDK